MRTLDDSRLDAGSFQDVNKVYFQQLCFTFTSRMWDMAIVLFIAKLTNNSLFVIAFLGVITGLMKVIFMPSIGKYLDQANRLQAIRNILVIKVVCVSIAYIICSDSKNSVESINGISDVPLNIILLLFTCSCAALAFQAISQSIEKDWIPVLSNGSSKWLSEVNAMISQIDLGCKSIAPAITGVLFSVMPANAVSILMAIINFAVALLLLNFMTHIYHQVPKLATKNESVEATKTDVEAAADKLRKNMPTDISLNKKYFFYDFINSGCCGMMVAYSFLYLTVLSFGSLMIVYLRWAGISDSLIGTSRGIAAIVEILGASHLYPYFTYRVGVHKAGTLAIWYQCGFVAIAAFSFSFASLDLVDSAKILIVAVLLSRAGLWMFDRCATQIGQETIKEDVRGVVNSQWTALYSAFEMLVYIIAMVYYDPSYFYILTSISFIMVFAAAIVYTATAASVAPNTLYSQLQNYGAVN